MTVNKKCLFDERNDEEMFLNGAGRLWFRSFVWYKSKELPCREKNLLYT